MSGSVNIPAAIGGGVTAGLVLVGMAGGLQTSWTCAWPHLTLLYLHHYFPDLVTRLVSWLGPRIVANMGTKYGATDTSE